MTVKFDFKSLGQPFEADWPVTVNVPKDGGGVDAQEFMARFRQIGDEELKEIREGDKDGLEVYRRFFVGLGPDAGAEWSHTLRDQMLATPHVRLALFKAFQGFNNGVAVKN